METIPPPSPPLPSFAVMYLFFCFVSYVWSPLLVLAATTPPASSCQLSTTSGRRLFLCFDRLGSFRAGLI
jgi:hypothetical protein